MAKVTIAELQAQLETAIGARNELEDRHNAVTADLATVTAQRDQHAGAVMRLTEANAAQAGEIRSLSASLSAFKGSATRARNEALVLKREKSPEARAIPAFAKATADKGATEDVERQRARIAFEDALRAGPIELVFSDGKREIRELAPLAVAGDAWREDARGFTLKFEPLLEPGEMARPEVSIVGVAALDEAGDQLAWQRWVEPVSVPRNGRVQLTAGHIRFAF